jgi:putative hydrolase of the HAD superfamily
MIGNDGICDVQGAKAVGLAAVYIRSNLSPAGPAPGADYVLDEMDLNRVGAILTGDGGPA